MKIYKYFTIIIALLFAGCALQSDYYKGKQELSKNRYDDAIAHFQSCLKEKPDDPKALAELGLAYLRKNDIQSAIQCIEKSRSVDPDYENTYLYLGMIYEAQNNLQKAVSEYTAYCQKNPLSSKSHKIKAHIKSLVHKQMMSDIQRAIAQENSIAVESIPENTIAVMHFSNLTGNKEFDPLGKGLTDIMITDLTSVRSLRVLERARLQLLMDELKLDKVDTSTTQRMGRLLGARRIINGSLALPDQKSFRMDALCTNVSSAQVDAQAESSGSMKRFFLIEKELVFAVLNKLSITLTQEERDKIGKIPTESFMAFMSYCHGLDYEDKGMDREAQKEFRKAVQIDPGFSLAVEKIQEFALPTDNLITVKQNISAGFITEPGAVDNYDRVQSQEQALKVLNITVDW